LPQIDEGDGAGDSADLTSSRAERGRLYLGMHMNLNKMLKNREIITLVPNAAECKNYLNRQHAYLQSLISRLLQIKI